MKDNEPYDVVIIGAGVSGAALLYMLSKYTDAKSIAVIEKHHLPARVATDPSQNSQTMHCGDIETNYSLEKAHVVRRATDMLRNYATAQHNAKDIIYKYPKMVIGVGEDECFKLMDRFTEFSPYYPNLRLIDRDEIVELEPNVMLDREDEIIAIGSTDEYSAVNFEALAYSFIEQAQFTDTKIKMFFNTELDSVQYKRGEYHLYDKQLNYFTARSVVVCAGAYSLKIAHDMGRGLNYSLLPVAGSYYFTPEVLNGKVYTVQNDALPFAAVHGDPDVVMPNLTRFGPTAAVLPFLERYNWKSLLDFFKVLRLDMRVIKTLWKTFRVKDVRNYMIRNFFLCLPFIGKRLFLKDVQKIVPSMTLDQITYADRFGGIRPQLIDKDRCEIVMGEAKIDEGDGIIFNMTPSPGATSCLDNAERDMESIAKHIGLNIDIENLNKDLLENNDTY